MNSDSKQMAYILGYSECQCRDCGEVFMTSPIVGNIDQCEACRQWQKDMLEIANAEEELEAEEASRQAELGRIGRMRVKVSFLYDEDAELWEVVVEGVGCELEALQAFDAVVMTAGMAIPKVECNKAKTLKQGVYKIVVGQQL